MRVVFVLAILCGALMWLGSDCGNPLFAPIDCEDDAECERECDALCRTADEVVMSAVCDANNFCDCLCMPGAGGSGGAGGSDG